MATTLNRFLKHRSVSALFYRNQHQGLFISTRYDSLPSQMPALQSTTRSFLDFYKFGNKKAIEDERARLNDEMNRGYFADMKEFKDHGGKIAAADKTLIPAVSAMKFPALAVTFSNGESLTLPVTPNSNEVNTEDLAVPKVSLVCLSFRASSQEMISSWSKPFLESFGNREDLQLFEVSFIDKWLLGFPPIKKLLLRVLQKPNNSEKNVLKRQAVYAFGDHYHFRKQIKVLNLLTGYIILLDKSGRIRWQGFGTATPEEVSQLLSCTSLLLEDK
ncbi:PREDICTED: mitochondrial ATPase complex subunit ATP10-like isoform X1 [Camelina sativa]|uniref:Mitochondrial ATPase complex subunit ATP10-like isoform X1 n=2 Tax=Camelina sativa TaxID=90675 RepID=A0ABM0WSP5_CAMSA|nr:PREDICTED: mitochondrial ATPase complex subunit ATP10-like isoform X1 [Camelina sativa]